VSRLQSNYPDRPLLDELTDAQRNAVIDGAKALAEHDQFKRTSFERWMAIARGVAPLCDLADRPGTSRKARKNFLKANGYGSLNEGTVSRLRWMAKLETAIRVWRDEPKNQRTRDSWNSPTSICNRCPAVRTAIAEANRTRPPRPKKAGNKPKALESAIDFILDHLHETEDADHRSAIFERILSPFGYVATAKNEKSRKARATAKAPTGALAWVDKSNDLHHSHEAPATVGMYLVNQALAFPSMQPAGYCVTHMPFGTIAGTRSLGNAQTVEKGKAIAQADHDAGRDAGPFEQPKPDPNAVARKRAKMARAKGT
jgi:hypothetical protein